MKRVCHSNVILTVLFLAAVSWAPISAQPFQQQQRDEDKKLPPVSGTYAITNATVFPSPGRKLEGTTVVISDGLIKAVGKNVSIPRDAIIVRGDSLFVYAGFIDGLSHAGVPKPKEEQSRERPRDPGNPSAEQAGITPDRDVRSLLDPADKSIEDIRSLGFTVAHTVPYGRMLPGSGAVVLLTGDTPDDMIIQHQSSLFSELAGAQRVYPATVMAVMAKFRELYRQAQQANTYQAAYASNPSGLPRPSSDRILEAFYPVIDKRVPVLFEADRYLDIQRILTLQSDLGFSLILGDVKEGWDAIGKIKPAGAKVFLSLDLPEAKKDEKQGDRKEGSRKEGAQSQSKNETSTLTPQEKEALEKRKNEFLAMYEGQASTFVKAGMPFGFSTLTAKPADIRKNLGRMIKAGLTEDQALAALTTQPAQLLGLSARLGTVEAGKMANLMLSDKPFFDEKANVRYVFVDGTMYKYDAKEAPKGDSKIDITGTWTVSTTMPQGVVEETLTIRSEGAGYAGSITSGASDAIALETIEFSGNTLKYTYSRGQAGQSQKVDVEVTVTGGTFKGNAAAGTAGTFSVEGKKNPDR